MRAPIISPTVLRFPPRAPIRQWRRFRVGLADYIDTGGYVPPDSAPPPPDLSAPSDSLPEVTVSNTPITEPVWPLVLILAAITYSAYWMGGHK